MDQKWYEKIELDDKHLVIICIAFLAGIAMFKTDNPVEVFTHTCAVLGGVAVGRKA